MINTNIHFIYPDKQHRQDGEYTMQGIALTRLIHNIIREYGKYDSNDYSVDVDAIDLADKRLILSHMESPEWYEWACESSMRTEKLFAEHAAYIQKLVDRESHEVFQEDMEEMRAYR